MSCKDIKEKIWRVFDRETSDIEKKEVHDHIVNCEECRELYEQVNTMMEYLDNLSGEKAPEGFTQRLRNR
ncbi:MAG: anti-sigma factor family protein, partial [Elusimicrobiota bacterium]